LFVFSWVKNPLTSLDTLLGSARKPLIIIEEFRPADCGASRAFDSLFCRPCYNRAKFSRITSSAAFEAVGANFGGAHYLLWNGDAG
jgi:hypothetical protein